MQHIDIKIKIILLITIKYQIFDNTRVNNNYYK